MFNLFKSKASTKPLEITDANFNDLIFNYDKPVLLDFKASWCQPCHVMISLVNRLAKEDEVKDRIRIGVVDIDMNPALAQHFAIQSVPTLLFIHDKKVRDKHNGLIPYPMLKEKTLTFIEDFS
ncbi:thiol reductase thioredoxin [Flavobacteriaceae bacterium Ap0902]|nr:thiol reductase thioredoxin [Flavobacteriaceae bacterium Ap0902]